MDTDDLSSALDRWQRRGSIPSISARYVVVRFPNTVTDPAYVRQLLDPLTYDEIVNLIKSGDARTSGVVFSSYRLKRHGGRVRILAEEVGSLTPDGRLTFKYVTDAWGEIGGMWNTLSAGEGALLNTGYAKIHGTIKLPEFYDYSMEVGDLVYVPPVVVYPEVVSASGVSSFVDGRLVFKASLIPDNSPFLARAGKAARDFPYPPSVTATFNPDTLCLERLEHQFGFIADGRYMREVIRTVDVPGTWFPVRALGYWAGSGHPNSMIAYYCCDEKTLEFPDAIPDAELSVPVRDGVRVIDEDLGVSYVKGDPETPAVILKPRRPLDCNCDSAAKLTE